ncbi:MAG: hypothetical protein V3V99_04595, partial [candidate division Zixibacteria bacterium]
GYEPAQTSEQQKAPDTRPWQYNQTNRNPAPAGFPLFSAVLANSVKKMLERVYVKIDSNHTVRIQFK